MDLIRSLRNTNIEISHLLELVEENELTQEAVSDTIKNLNCELECICDAIADVVMNLDNDIIVIKSEIARLNERKQSFEKSKDMLKSGLVEYLKQNDAKKISTALHTISICKNGGKVGVNITSDKIPWEYQKVVTSPNIDKIRQDLENGKQLEFAELKERGESLRIK